MVTLFRPIMSPRFTALTALALLAAALSANAFVVPERPGGLRLIETGPETREWLSEAQVLQKIRNRERFIDVTDSLSYESEIYPDVVSAVAIPGVLSQQSVVKPMFRNISQEGMKDFLRKFTAFHTRYYRSETGVESTRWLLASLKEIAESRADKDNVDVSINTFQHDGFNQPSIIVRIAAKKNTAQDGPQKPIQPDAKDVVIIGCHIDSVNGWNPWFGRSPGADDNGSGTTTAREAFRILMASGFVPKHPIEFHFNAAEEGGLLGSQAIAAQYKKEGRPVLGMMQMDMSGYDSATGSDKREVIGVGTDFVDDQLSQFLRKVIDEYCQVKWVETRCGYGCSDHASWYKQGYRTTFPFEAPFESHNSAIHTRWAIVVHRLH